MLELFTNIPSHYYLAATGAFLLGIAKSGVKGIAVFIVVLFVFAFDAKASTGILMPLLILGDVFAIIYYKKHAHWKYVFQLIPWMCLGVLLGTYGGNLLDKTTFKIGIESFVTFVSKIFIYLPVSNTKMLITFLYESNIFPTILHGNFEFFSK